MEYSKVGAVIVQVCMFNHAHFNLVKRYDQCRDFTNENDRSNADDTDANTDVVFHTNGPATDGDNSAGADARD